MKAYVLFRSPLNCHKIEETQIVLFWEGNLTKKNSPGVLCKWKFFFSYFSIYPKIKNCNPDIIFVSSGFDAAEGDPLGGYNVTPQYYGTIIKELKKICPKVICALEGGYNLDTIKKCTLECMKSLI